MLFRSGKWEIYSFADRCTFEAPTLTLPLNVEGFKRSLPAEYQMFAGQIKATVSADGQTLSYDFSMSEDDDSSISLDIARTGDRCEAYQQYDA